MLRQGPDGCQLWGGGSGVGGEDGKGGEAVTRICDGAYVACLILQ